MNGVYIEVGWDGKKYNHRIITPGRSLSPYPSVLFHTLDNAIEGANDTALAFGDCPVVLSSDVQEIIDSKASK
jgi:hypothetical protein